MESNWRMNAWNWGWQREGSVLAARLLDVGTFYIMIAEDFPIPAFRFYFFPPGAVVPFEVGVDFYQFGRPPFPNGRVVTPD